MLKRTLIVVVLSSLLFWVGLMACRTMIESAMEPDQIFSAADAPPPPDYTLESAWAALPTRADGADVSPQSSPDAQDSAAVDVFYIHPTTYFSGAHWNQPLDHEATNKRTREQVARNQASVFNAAARVYMPYYRQATLFSRTTVERAEEGDAAMAFAYQDVEAAFDLYMRDHNGGRPFIIASHSQGSFHGQRLLAERISGTALHDQLVAAYLIGFPLAEKVVISATPDIPVCQSPAQSGCLVSWNTVMPEAEIERFSHAIPLYEAGGYVRRHVPEPVCVNPLNWSASGAPAARSANLGAVRYDDGPHIDERPTGARCVKGLLTVDADLDASYQKLIGRKGDLHLHDYSLFYMNVRENVALRVSNYLSARADESVESE